MDEETVQHRIMEERRLTGIESEMQDVKDTLAKLQQDVAELVYAWKAAAWLVSVVKWIGGISISLAAIYSMVKGFK